MRHVTVKTIHLGREFRTSSGTVEALKDININTYEGEIFGVLGPNGAGKTTLIRILSTLLLPTKGEARVMGYDVAKEPEKVREVINMSSGAERAGYDFISARKNLWFFSQLYGLNPKEANRKIEELAEELKFKNFLDSKFYSLSTGYRQRATIARAFLNSPSVVFLDEPTVGLDVMTAVEIREFLRRNANQGTTIFLATHNMAEVEAICDRVAIIDRGRIVAHGVPEQLKKEEGKAVYVIELRPILLNHEIIKDSNGIRGFTLEHDHERNSSSLRLVADNDECINKLISRIENRGYRIISSWRREPTLEEVFISIVGKGFRERESET